MAQLPNTLRRLNLNLALLSEAHCLLKFFQFFPTAALFLCGSHTIFLVSFDLEVCLALGGRGLGVICDVFTFNF